MLGVHDVLVGVRSGVLAMPNMADVLNALVCDPGGAMGLGDGLCDSCGRISASRGRRLPSGALLRESRRGQNAGGDERDCNLPQHEINLSAWRLTGEMRRAFDRPIRSACNPAQTRLNLR